MLFGDFPEFRSGPGVPSSSPSKLFYPQSQVSPSQVRKPGPQLLAGHHASKFLQVCKYASRPRMFARSQVCMTWDCFGTCRPSPLVPLSDHSLPPLVPCPIPLCSPSGLQSSRGAYCAPGVHPSHNSFCRCCRSDGVHSSLFGLAPKGTDAWRGSLGSSLRGLWLSPFCVYSVRASGPWRRCTYRTGGVRWVP